MPHEQFIDIGGTGSCFHRNDKHETHPVERQTFPSRRITHALNTLHAGRSVLNAVIEPMLPILRFKVKTFKCECNVDQYEHCYNHGNSKFIKILIAGLLIYRRIYWNKINETPNIIRMYGRYWILYAAFAESILNPVKLCVYCSWNSYGWEFNRQADHCK